MNDKEINIWDQYGLEVNRTYKGRGSIICETNSGIKLLKELNCHKSRIEFQNQVQELIKESDAFSIDCYLKNQEGEFITKDDFGTEYVVKNWFEGREIDLSNTKEILQAVKIMALMHNDMVFNSSEQAEKCKCEELSEEFEKHNKEIKKIRNFIRNKNKKSDYEMCFLSVFEMFANDGANAYDRLVKSNYGKINDTAKRLGKVCHGDYNQHNILITKTKPAITNFDKCKIGVQTSDLYNFMRKILEKHRWNITLGKNMLLSYNEIKELSSDEMENLLIRFIYPEKFWKIANHYYNSNKAWTPIKNIEKLQMLAEQNKTKWNFIETVFEKYI